MKKFLLITIISSGIFFCRGISQTKLTAIYDVVNSSVKLTWNMVNSNTRTRYLLLRSSDGIIWTEAAKDQMLRNYSDEDIYFFNDRFYVSGKNLYRLKISDGNNNTIALSPVVVVNTSGTIKTNIPSVNTQKQSSDREIIQTQSKVPIKSNNNWIIYPNPVTDLLKVLYKGSEELKGVVNVQILDGGGKTVIKFRSGSMYKTIQIPVSTLKSGIYFIQVTMLNEIMMNQKFIKQ